MNPNPRDHWVVLGKVGTVYGLRGWLKVHSYTTPKEAILQYNPWYLRHAGTWLPVEVQDGRTHGQGLVAHFSNCTDCDQARLYVNAEIAVKREQLLPLPSNEYYWTDLIGLRVWNTQGICLGKVVSLLETGSNDVLVVKGENEYFIPYLPDEVVLEVDLAQQSMTVDWDSKF